MKIETLKLRKRENLYPLIFIVLVGVSVGSLVPFLQMYNAGMVIVFFLGFPFIVVAFAAVFKAPIRSLFAFVFILPVHSLVITILLEQVGLPLKLARLIAAWKEGLLIATFILVIVRILVKRKSVPLVWMDWIAASWLFQVLIYFVFHDLLFDWPADLTTRLYGARDWILYLLPYFIGRLVPVHKRDILRLLRCILLVGTITSIIGIVEYFVVPTSWHTKLGVSQYFYRMLNLDYSTYRFGLPANYFALFGGRIIRRSVSTYLSGQGFALPFLIIIPVAVYNWMAKLTKYNLLILFLCTGALLLTITRMTILVCFIQIFLVLWLLRASKTIFRILLIVFIVISVAFLGDARFRSYVADTITLQDPSSSNRPEQWEVGFKGLLTDPLGFGLASTGQISGRLGLTIGTRIRGEAGYFKLTGALGFPGLVFFLSWFFVIIVSGYLVYRRRKGVEQGLAIVTMAASMGFLLNNLTAPPDQSLFVIYVFGWLAGLTVQLATHPTRSEKKCD